MEGRGFLRGNLWPGGGWRAGDLEQGGCGLKRGSQGLGRGSEGLGGLGPGGGLGSRGTGRMDGCSDRGSDVCSFVWTNG